MLDLRQAQIKARQTTNQYKKTIDSVKWTEIYNNEQEIIEDLKQIHIPSNTELSYIGTLYNGYEFIHSFAKLVQLGKSLKDKQIVQCKRLALEIKKAYSIKECFTR
jgi:hypothetical protein